MTDRTPLTVSALFAGLVIEGSLPGNPGLCFAIHADDRAAFRAKYGYVPRTLREEACAILKDFALTSDAKGLAAQSILAYGRFS